MKLPPKPKPAPPAPDAPGAAVLRELLGGDQELYALLAYQQAWLADPAVVRIIEKSRRVGLSWAMAAEAVLTAGRAEAPQDVWYIGYNHDMAQEFIRDCAFWAKHFGEAARAAEEFLFDDEDDEGNTRQIKAFRVDFASGKRITALSSRPSNLRGKQGLVIIDEAAFHMELAELLKAALALTIWGGRVCIISTHNGEGNPFNDLVKEVREGKKPYSLHRVTLDDALQQGLYRRICLKLGRAWSPEAEAAWRAELFNLYGDGADEELLCVPRGAQGAFIPRATVEARMDAGSPVIRWALPDSFARQSDVVRRAVVAAWVDENLRPLFAKFPSNARGWVGQDFGRSGDLSVIAPLLADQRLGRRVPFMVELRNVPFTEQEFILCAIGQAIPGLMGMALDATGNGSFLAERAAQVFGWSRVAQVKFSEAWYLAEMPPFKAAIEDGAITGIPKDADVLQDFAGLQVIKGIPKVSDGRRKGAQGEQRHADAAVALVLGYFASRREAPPIEFEAVGGEDHMNADTLSDWMEAG